MEKLSNNLFIVPQVLLLTKGPYFHPIIDKLVKRIICLNPSTCQKVLCNNCQKFQSSNYFDLKWLKLNNNKLLKKQDVTDLINELSIISLEVQSPKICIIEQIEYATIEASNVFLKFLENINANTYVIFTTNNKDKVLSTIKSRSQVWNFSLKNTSKVKTTSDEEDLLLLLSNEFNYDFYQENVNDFPIILKTIKQFIVNDNNQSFTNNFFLIKELTNLPSKNILFLKIIFLLAKNKLFKLTISKEINSNTIFNNLLKSWNNANQQFLLKILETVILLENNFNNKINLNLLLNNFFIIVYQGVLKNDR